MRLLLLFFLLPLALPAQELTNVQFRQEGQAVIVSYDLIPQHADDRFEVALYVSLNGGSMYLGPLSQVQGHSGPDQAGGYLRQMRWEAVAELGQIAAAQARFKVRATQTRAGGSRPADLPPLPTMIRIPGGTFQMGSKEGGPDEKPVHTVTVSDFYLAETEVTFEQYDHFCEATGRSKPDDKGYGRGNRPVINVSWNDAQDYCRWLSQTTGQTYRLPTEAEWEYAAGGGASGRTKWAGTNSEGDLGSYAVYSSTSGTSPVKSKRPNRLGLYDMTGNVWEWCQDWYGSDYYASSPSRDPRGPDSGAYRVLRGGSWSRLPAYARVADRNFYTPSYRYYHGGFRPARIP